LPLIASLILIYRSSLNIKWRRQLAVLAVYSIMVLGWIGYNYSRSGMAVLSTNPQVSFYIYEPPTLRMVDELSWPGYIRVAMLNPEELGRHFLKHEKSVTRELMPEKCPPHTNLWFSSEDPTAIRKISQRAADYVAGRETTIIGIHIFGILGSMRPQWNSAGVLNRFLDALRIAMLPIAVWLLWKRREWWWMALLFIWTAFMLLPPGPVSCWRFRAPVEPIISMVLAVALAPVCSGLFGRLKARSGSCKERRG
jgi:hypothetical protein